MAVYQKLLDSIRKQIRSGQVPVGGCVGTEVALAEEFGISRSSVRTAVDMLVEEGMVVREAGRGLFVSGSVQPTLALVVPTLHNMWGHIAEAAKEACIEQGALLQIHSAYGDLEKDLRTLRELPDQPVQGLIVGSLHRPELNAAVLELWQQRVPFVLADQTFADVVLPSVRFDDYAAGRLAAERLLALGHQCIAFVGYTGYTRDGRLDGVRDAVNDAGYALPASLQVTVPLTEMIREHRTAMVAGLRALLAADRRPTAIVCHHSGLAVDVLALARELGLSIPNELSLVTIFADPMPFSHEPPLSGVGLPAAEIGRLAVNMLLGRINEPERKPEQKVLAPSWRPGGTVAPNA